MWHQFQVMFYLKDIKLLILSTTCESFFQYFHHLALEWLPKLYLVLVTLALVQEQLCFYKNMFHLQWFELHHVVVIEICLFTCISSTKALRSALVKGRSTRNSSTSFCNSSFISITSPSSYSNLWICLYKPILACSVQASWPLVDFKVFFALSNAYSNFFQSLDSFQNCTFSRFRCFCNASRTTPTSFMHSSSPWITFLYSLLWASCEFPCKHILLASWSS
jgi:hypothetical protein